MVFPKEVYNRYKKSIKIKEVKHFGLPVIFVVGKPGCGKASMCHGLQRLHDFSYVSIGQMLRDEASTNTKRGKRIAEFVYHEPFSKPVPQELVLELLREVLGRFLYIHKPVIIQGFPRTYAQAAQLEKEGVPIKHMLYLTISNEKAEERYLDKVKYVEHLPDQTEHIKCALEAFEKTTIPVIDGLKKEKRVVEIDAEADPEKVLEEALKIYEKWLMRSKQGIDFLEKYKTLAGAQSYENPRRSI